MIVEVEFRKFSGQSKEGSIYYLVKHEQFHLRMKSNYVLFENEWDNEIRDIIIDAGERKDYIGKIRCFVIAERDLLEKIVCRFIENKSRYTVDDVYREYNRLLSEMSFFSFIDGCISVLRTEGHWGTAQNYMRARNSFIEFIGCDMLPFTAITGELMVIYDRWLRKKEVSRNSRSFYMRQLRSVYNKAVNLGLTTQHFPFKSVYTGIDKTRKRAVEESVIKRLIRLNLSCCSSLSFTRDLFLFSFYMRGIAFVDMAFLKKSNVRNGFIRYTRRKTGCLMEVKLEDCMKEILERYAHKVSYSEYLLPIITEKDEDKAYKQYQNKRSYYNKQLKKLSDMLCLEIPLTSYVARHTWATIARNMNISLSVISAGMGHTSETMTKIYLASLDASMIDNANSRILSCLECI